MHKIPPNIYYSIVTVLATIFITVIVFNPLWGLLDIHVPGEREIKVDFTNPVDAIFYIRNAQQGYVWNTSSPTSLWFHPLLAWLIKFTPHTIPANFRLWIISVIAGCFSLAIIPKYIEEISAFSFDKRLIIFAPILPGGLAIATGNAEFLCLLFTTLLTISLFVRSSPLYSFVFGGLAILSKPNALYMVPLLLVYFIWGITQARNDLSLRCIAGGAGILIIWALWIFVVDLNAHKFGGYWEVRQLGSVPLFSGPFSLLQRMARAFVFYDFAEKLRYTTAIANPLVHLWILLLIPLKDEAHRLAIFAGISALLFITLSINNPNKIIVYSVTFPGYFAIGLLFIQQTLLTPFRKITETKIDFFIRKVAGAGYLVYCLAMAIFFVFGTALEWYY